MNDYQSMSMFIDTFSKFFDLINGKCGVSFNPRSAGYELAKKAYHLYQMEGFDFSDDWRFTGIMDWFDKNVNPHKAQVFIAGMNLYKALPQKLQDSIGKKDDIVRQLIEHDLSKYCYHERWGYTAYDFKAKAFDSGFEAAWNHHQKHNPHHPEYWVSVNKDGSVFALEMPWLYIWEMVADWIGAGATYGNRIENWLPNNLGRFFFHIETAKKLVEILAVVMGSGWSYDIVHKTGTILEQTGCNIYIKEIQ